MPKGKEQPTNHEGRKAAFRVRQIVFLTNASLVTGLATYGAVELTAELVWGYRSRLNVPPRPEIPVLPTNREGARLLEPDRDLHALIRQSLTTYENWQNFGKGRLQPLLNVQQPEEVVELLERSGRNFVIEGVNVLQTTWLLGYSRDLVGTDASAKNLWINGEHFDLESRYQRQLAAAWIQTKVEILDRSVDGFIIKEQGKMDRFTEEEITLQESELQEDLELLMWLKRRNVPIAMTDESFAFFPKEKMVTLARVFQAVDQLGFNLPNSAEWCSSTCLNWLNRKEEMMNEEGEIKEVDFESIGAALTNDEIKLENTAGAGSFAHELGHLVSDRNNFLEDFKSLRGYRGQAPAEDRLAHISLYATENVDEDFAVTFMNYLMNGDYFRALLDELQVHAPEAWQTLQQKYDFMRNKVFNGTEFSKDARTRIPYLEEREQEFAGFYWSPQTHSLEIRPNPEVWPGKRRLSKVYPVLVDGRRKNVKIEFAYDPKNRSYEVYIPDSRLISKITLFPSSGNDMIVFVALSDGKEVEQGVESSKTISPSSSGDLQLKVLSLPPIRR